MKVFSDNPERPNNKNEMIRLSNDKYKENIFLTIREFLEPFLDIKQNDIDNVKVIINQKGYKHIITLKNGIKIEV